MSTIHNQQAVDDVTRALSSVAETALGKEYLRRLARQEAVDDCLEVLARQVATRLPWTYGVYARIPPKSVKPGVAALAVLHPEYIAIFPNRDHIGETDYVNYPTCGTASLTSGPALQRANIQAQVSILVDGKAYPITIRKVESQPNDSENTLEVFIRGYVDQRAIHVARAQRPPVAPPTKAKPKREDRWQFRF